MLGGGQADEEGGYRGRRSRDVVCGVASNIQQQRDVDEPRVDIQRLCDVAYPVLESALAVLVLFGHGWFLAFAAAVDSKAKTKLAVKPRQRKPYSCA